MKANSVRMRSVDLETTTGLTVSHIPAIGPKTRWMVTETSLGRTAKSTKETLSTTNARATVPSFGLMVASTSARGRLANSTASALILAKTESQSKVSGKMVAKSAGFKMTACKMITRRTD